VRQIEDKRKKNKKIRLVRAYFRHILMESAVKKINVFNAGDINDSIRRR
jgi:hypothetical protein